jgi:4-hydroxy-tetrahydrodipicolinate reductase
MNLTPVTIIGARGRMGRALCAAAESEGFTMVRQCEEENDLRDALAASAVGIDFSVPHVSPLAAQRAAALGRPLVIGTTGHTSEQLDTIRAAAADVAIVLSPNFSVGVNALFWLTRRAAEILGPGFDLEVVEMHHNLKKDAPSGTARRLAEILCEVRDLQYAADVRHGREGWIGERTQREIGMHAIRGGDVVGDHTVVFAAAGERVELTHKASSRETFARGALRAARWALDRSPGLYDMQDVLGLR